MEANENISNCKFNEIEIFFYCNSFPAETFAQIFKLH